MLNVENVISILPCRKAGEAQRNREIYCFNSKKISVSLHYAQIAGRT